MVATSSARIVLRRGEASSSRRARTRRARGSSMAKNILRTGKKTRPKTAVKGKRYRCALNEDFLLDVMKSSFNLMR